MGAGAMLGALVSNRALTGLIAAALVMLVGMMLQMGMISYTFNEYFDNGRLLSAANFVGLLPTLLMVPLARPSPSGSASARSASSAWP